MRHIVNIFLLLLSFCLPKYGDGRCRFAARPEQASSLFPHRQRSDVFIFPIGRQARGLFHAMISLEHLGSICEYQLFQIKSCEMGEIILQMQILCGIMSTKQLRMQCKENPNELRIYVFLRQAVAPSYRPEAEEKDLQGKSRAQLERYRQNWDAARACRLKLWQKYALR